MVGLSESPCGYTCYQLQFASTKDACSRDYPRNTILFTCGSICGTRSMELRSEGFNFVSSSDHKKPVNSGIQKILGRSVAIDWVAFLLLSGYCPETGSCEHGNEISASTEGEKFSWPGNRILSQLKLCSVQSVRKGQNHISSNRNVVIFSKSAHHGTRLKRHNPYRNT